MSATVAVVVIDVGGIAVKKGPREHIGMSKVAPMSYVVVAYGYGVWWGMHRHDE